MSIVEIVSRPTHRSLMNKSKSDLASLVLECLEVNAKQQKQIETLKAQRDTAYGYGRDGGEPPWMK